VTITLEVENLFIQNQNKSCFNRFFCSVLNYGYSKRISNLSDEHKNNYCNQKNLSKKKAVSISIKALLTAYLKKFVIF